MTNLNLPEHWSKLVSDTCAFEIKKSSLKTVGRFQIFQHDELEYVLYIHDTITKESWGCDCDFDDKNPVEEIKEVEEILNNYLEMGKQLSLF